MGKAYFLSDMHLGAPYFSDSRERELRVVRFLESIAGDASELYLLGDVLDYWYEYRYVVPRGYVRFFGTLARLSDSGVKITWIIGNHDIWIFDYIPSELGIEVVDGLLDRQILGTRFLMAHGDGIWQHSRKFAFIRALFRNKICQRLFSAIHPRWTVPFAYAWSAQSRRDGEEKLQSRADFLQQTDPDSNNNVKGITDNIEALRKFSIDYAEKHPETKYFLYGHLHLLIQKNLPDDRKMIILGDWINYNSYAVFDGKNLLLKRFIG